MWRPRVNLLCAGTLALLLALPALCRSQELSGQVIDENGVAVAAVQVSLSRGGLKVPLTAVSDAAGRFLFAAVPPGSYELRAEKPGYYATISRALEIKARAAPLEVVLNHQQEFEETVNVIYSAPAVDRKEASVTKSLTAEEIVALPFHATHDFRNALPLMPGVIKDNSGRIHLNGGGENQAFYSLDGFNITSPVSGVLENRISVDAIRALQIETSRYSAENGKGSAGVMALESSRGDDRFRFSSTDFFPSMEWHRKPAISNWNPRATISGPIFKGRAWYYNALDLQYDMNTVKELPGGANTNHSWLGGNLTRIQVNLTSKNLLTGGILFNFSETVREGMSPLDPLETSRDRSERFYFINMKDQAYLSGGWVLETGIALNRINRQTAPQGNATYVISPRGRSGNYFMRSQGNVGRLQALATVMPPVWNWRGRHSIKFGLDGNRITYCQLSQRAAFEIRSDAGILSRLVSFQGNPRFGRISSEFSGFLQDSWTMSERLFIEAGMRFDWDQVLRQPLWSPRLAVTWGPARFPNSKLSAGIGIFHDAMNLSLLTRAQDQQRSDSFYDAAGVPIVANPVISRYFADEQTLRAPFYLNWSLGWEQKLGRGFYLKTNFIRKHGYRGWAYDLLPQSVPAPAPDIYRLENTRRDSYFYAELALSRTFKGKYPWLLSYARSRARASEVIDFTLENPIFARQASGPLDWDAPNRLISWSVFPLPRFQKYSLAYFVEWRSGMPWSRVNQRQQLVGAPNSNRFPDYFNINLHLERRIRFWRSEWALRVGFNDLTGHKNPTAVNNNVDSADFGQFSRSQERVFTGRIRFIGRN